MSWEDVANYESLAALNMKIAEDDLDDCIKYLAEDLKNLDEALNCSKQIKGSNCIGYS